MDTKSDQQIISFLKIKHNYALNQDALISLDYFQQEDVICSFSNSIEVAVPTRFTVQIDNDKHVSLIPQVLEKINHSCDPNVFFDVKTKELIALKEIHTGDELTFFYPSTEWDMIQPFLCFCSNSNCIGTIDGANYLSIDILEKYRLSNHIFYLKKSCPCSSGNLFNNCCEPFINGRLKPQTAEQLMRSRYSVYTIQAIDYLLKTTHASQRGLYSPKEMKKWATESTWQKLEIINVTETTVEFKAHFLNNDKVYQVHHEHSRFILEEGKWYYINGEYPD